jgi:hypothetical protein
MRLAIITDLHADVHALRDALAQIERLGCRVRGRHRRYT